METSQEEQSAELSSIIEFYHQQAVIRISHNTIQTFAENFLEQNYETFQSKTQPLKVPLIFPDVTDECSFFSLFYFLSVGSMFENRCSEASQSCLTDVVLFGIFGAYISLSHLDSSFMKSISPSDAGQYFALPLTEVVDTKDSAPFLTMEKPGGLIKLAELYSNVLVQTGIEIEKRGYKNLSSFLFHVISGNCTPEGLERVCRELSEVFPHLDDRHFVSKTRNEDPGSEVISELCFFTTLRRLLFDICHRFDERGTHGGKAIPGISSSGLNRLLAAPNVKAINALIQIGILTLPDESAGNIRDVLLGGGIGSEVAIRAAALYACHLLSMAINECHPKAVVSPLAISVYLESLDEYRVGEERFIPFESGLKW